MQRLQEHLFARHGRQLLLRLVQGYLALLHLASDVFDRLLYARAEQGLAAEGRRQAVPVFGERVLVEVSSAGGERTEGLVSGEGGRASGLLELGRARRDDGRLGWLCLLALARLVCLLQRLIDLGHVSRTALRQMFGPRGNRIHHVPLWATGHLLHFVEIQQVHLGPGRRHCGFSAELDGSGSLSKVAVNEWEGFLRGAGDHLEQLGRCRVIWLGAPHGHCHGHLSGPLVEESPLGRCLLLIRSNVAAAFPFVVFVRVHR